MTMTTSYAIRSIKATETIRGTQAEAVERAIRHEETYQPAWGVEIWRGAEQIAEVRDGEVEYTDAAEWPVELWVVTSATSEY